MERVEDLIVEVEEVRPRGRRLRREHVHDEHRAVRVLPAAECVDVREVRRRIERDERRLPVAGRPRGRRGAQELEKDHERRECVSGVAMLDALHNDLLP